MRCEFYKYQGAGNDFVLMDGRGEGWKPDAAQIARICDRRFGIGSDGFMLLEDDPEAEFYMRYYNANGGEVAMCGNGGRCIALFADHLGIGGARKVFNSLDGRHEGELTQVDGDGGRIRLQMIDVNGYEIHDKYLLIDTGVLHYVEFVTDLDAVDVVKLGREIRYSDIFVSRGGTNVNFVQIIPDGSIRIRTYERGVEDETFACGTGAVACAMATNLLCNPAQTDFRVGVRGGELHVSFNKVGNQGFKDVFLEGPAVRVFECELDLDNFFSK